MQRSNKDIVLFSFLACLWGVQAAVALQQLLGMRHAPLMLQGTLLPEALVRMAPKWDLLLFGVFVAVALGTGLLILRYVKKPADPWFIAFEAMLTFLMVSAAFKMVIYDNSPLLAQRSLTGLMIVGVLFKIFYPEIKKSSAGLYHWLTRIPWTLFADLWWIAVIVLTIYMPHLEHVIAMIFMGDWLHHFDYLIMSVGWASLWGQIPYADIISQYGVGLPLIFAKIIKFSGRFDYVSALRVMMWFVIVYFALTYFLVRYWLKSALIAGVAFLLIFRMQMFHYGVSPLVWATPSASPVRFGLDILWMLFILLHLRTSQARWLVLAALYSGFAIYYMTSVGVCAAGAFYVYLFALIFIPSPKKTAAYYLSWFLPILSAAAFFAITLKGHILQREYWHNLIDYMVVFAHTGAMPMWESLKYRHFWAFFMSMVMPFTYMATFLYIAARLYIEKGSSERLFVAILCVYGLANYQYYVVRAAITSYYVDVLPFVLVVCFWFMRALEFCSPDWRMRLKAAAVILSFYALWTNHNYLAYPNLMSFSSHPMTDNLVIQRFPDRQGYFNVMYKKAKEEDKLKVNDLGTTDEDIRTEDDFKNDTELVKYYRKSFDFRRDAALIDKFTKPGQKVALLSSFETRILIQANRPPFFYHFPLLTSRPMTFRSLPSDDANTPAYLGDTIGALQKRHPTYVFLEKIFLLDSLPPSYYNYGNKRREKVLAITAYIKAFYTPVEQGQYLVAMKLKGS